MPVDFDDDDFELSDEDKAQMYGAFKNQGKPSFNAPETGTRDATFGRDISSNWDEIECWDDCLTNKEKAAITCLDMHHIPKPRRCPCLRQPRDAQLFFYCQQEADEQNRTLKYPFTMNTPQPNSAELQAIIREAPVLEETCTKPDSFTKCANYKTWVKEHGD